MNLSHSLSSLYRLGRPRLVAVVPRLIAATCVGSSCSVSPNAGDEQPSNAVTLPARQCQLASRVSTQQRRCLHASSALQSATGSTAADKAADNAGDILCSLTPAPAGSGDIATITLSNPRRLNSLNSVLIAKLTETLKSLASNPDLRCVVIQGETQLNKTASFTSGANIYEMAALKTYDDAADFISRLSGACQAMRNLPVPTIAKIHGLCVGGGLELVAGCDFRYATRTSVFSMPETKYGIPSVIEARLLANIIGWQKAKEMVYLAKFYEAPEMEKWGLVDECCADVEELDEKVDEFVKTVSSYGPQTMRAQKRLIKVWEENDLVTGINAGVDSYASMFKDGGSEPAEYMKAFTERKR